MRLALSETDRALVSQWRALTADLAPSARAAWTRQGWIPRGVVDAAPDVSPDPAGTPCARDAITIMESARLHECAPEVMAAAVLRRFLEAASGPAASGTAAPGPAAPGPAAPGAAAPGPRPPRLIIPWPDSAWDSELAGAVGTGAILAGDDSADRAWLVAADPGTRPRGAAVVQTGFAPQPGGPGGPGGYPVGRDHPPYRFPVPGETGPAVVGHLDPGQFAAFRDLVRIAGACVLVGLIDTIFDAIVVAARRKAAASEDRWAAQADKHGAVDIAIRRDTAWLHLFRGVDSFGDPGGRALFGALALTEAAAGLGDAVAYRRGIAHRSGDRDALAATDLAAAQRDFWLDLAGGTSALADAVSRTQLGPPAAVGQHPAPG